MSADIRQIAVDERKEPQMRLLLCRHCKSLEELPDHEGRPEDDVLLQIAVERHQNPGCQNAGQLFKFPVKYWMIDRARNQILEQIKAGGSSGLDVVAQGYYATRSQFGEDAMQCWALHNRTTDCGEYKADRKLLKPNTVAERKDAGLGMDTAPTIYLCDFCPVKSVKQKAAFKDKGLYK